MIGRRERVRDKAAERTQLRRLARRLHLPFIASVCALTLGNYFITLPYYLMSPGSATSLNKYITVDEAKSFPPDGDVLFTTVSLREAHPFDVIWAAILPSQVLEKREEVSGDYTREQFLELNNAAMDDSKLTATKVALTRAGHPVVTTGNGALVQQITENSPAHGKLEPGDVITSVDDRRIAVSTDLTEAIAAKAPGAPVALTIRGHDKTTRTENLALGERPDKPGTAYLGTVVSTAEVRLETPFPVSIDTTDVGGPSAGLAFTLALLDQLTPGALTGGKDVAVTGTINSDGTVGPVGGVVQKSYAVNRSGAKLFLVPSDEYEDAKKSVDTDVVVARVDTLQQAIDALARNGGDVSGMPAASVMAAS